MSAWQKRARLVIAIIGLAAVVLVLLTIRRRPDPNPAGNQRAVDPTAKIEASRGRILLASGSESRGFVDFASQLTYADGSSKLIQPCATTRRQGRETRICAREAHVGAERSHINMTGGVSVSGKDGLEAQTDEATYSEGEGIVRARGKVTFGKGALTGAAVGMSYDEKRDLLSLQNEVVVRVASGKEGGGLEISSGSAEYARAEKHMRFEGEVRMVRAGNVITADSALAHLTADEQRVEALELRGNARIERSGDGEASHQNMSARDMNLTIGPDGETLQRAVLIGNGSIDEAAGGRRGRRISAEMLDLTFHPTGTLAKMTARDDVELTLAAQGDAPERNVTSKTMDGTGEPDGGLTAARFVGDVEFREQVTGKPPRVGRAKTLDVRLQPKSGEIDEARFGGGTAFEDGTLRTSSLDARYQVAKGILELTGAQGRNDPRVEDDRLTVDARRIDVTLQGPKLNAKENVRSVIRPEPKKPSGRARTVPGMLKGDQPAYVTAAALDYDGEKSLATYTGDARLWQADTSIQAASIAIDEQSGNLTARESVRSAFVLEERNEATKEVTRTPSTATAKEMHFENEQRRATYRTDAHMVGPQGDLRADRIVLYFLEGGGSLERAEAYTNVRVAAEKRTATGDRLTYFASDARYLLTGAPVRTIEECRETTCKSLTFWRSADRIACDGQEENRTLTTNAGSCTESRTK